MQHIFCVPSFQFRSRLFLNRATLEHFFLILGQFELNRQHQHQHQQQQLQQQQHRVASFLFRGSILLKFVL